MIRSLIQITLQQLTFGLVVDDGVVTSAPPVARWAKGEELEKVVGYYLDRGAEVTVVRTECGGVDEIDG